MRTLNRIMKLAVLLFLWAALTVALSAGNASDPPRLHTLYNFDGADGGAPMYALVQGTDGNFYGTATVGGAYASGTVFKITPSGTLTTLYNFGYDYHYTNGGSPAAGLVQGTNGNFYGTATIGGINSDGTVFEITPEGELTTLHSFDGTDGQTPVGNMILGSDGNFYGATWYGGAYGYGTVFKLTPAGALTTVHSFALTDGDQPTGLVQASNGYFYGTTAEGGYNGGGTVFKLSQSGALATIYNFCSQEACVDGDGPYGLIQAANGNFYGTTVTGGTDNMGTVFTLTHDGTFTMLHSFHGLDGRYPYSALVEGTDGNLYGTTFEGGNNHVYYTCEMGCGTAFKITPTGRLASLYSFCSRGGSNCRDGVAPIAPLIQATNGNFYGGTARGGTDIYAGTVFGLSVGLGPFVTTQPTSAVAGAGVNILGTHLTGATSVTFDGTAATFTVVSSSEITTTVPIGATTGKIQVVTPGGTLSSSVAFRVLP
jgi:uncharacterized repeat protein (TIGR03803 family)